MNRSQQPSLAILDVLIIVMAKWYLLVDASNGIVLSAFGVSLPLSAAYKSALLVLIGCALARHQLSKLAAILALIPLLLAGPFYSALHTSNLAGFSYDAGMVLKLLSPLLAAVYFYYFSQRHPVAAKLALHQIMLTSFAILFINILLGRLGFGFAAYLPNDYFPDLNLGTKGFFKATNELSALLLVLSGYLFAYYWPQCKWRFLLCVALAWFIASAMLTKTGLMGVLLLAIGVPLLQSRRYWLPYQRWVIAALFVSVVCAALLLWQLPLILQTFGVGQKLQLTYQQQGLLGVILSSRDVFAAENWDLAELYFSDWHRLIGIGVAGLGLYAQKPLAEIDPFDLLLWFGTFGLAYYVLWFVMVIRQSLWGYLTQPDSVIAGLLFINLLLLLVASMAGHTMTSGMLWIPWGMFNGAVWIYAQQQNAPAEQLHSDTSKAVRQ